MQFTIIICQRGEWVSLGRVQTVKKGLIQIGAGGWGGLDFSFPLSDICPSLPSFFFWFSASSFFNWKVGVGIIHIWCLLLYLCPLPWSAGCIFLPFPHREAIQLLLTFNKFPGSSSSPPQDKNILSCWFIALFFLFECELKPLAFFIPVKTTFL